MNSRFFNIRVVILLPFSIVLSAWAGEERATAEEAVRLVNRAVQYLKENGEEKAFAEFSKSKSESGSFVSKDLYIFVYDTKGRMHAAGNGNARKMVGRELYDFRDADGVYFVRGLIKVTEQTGKGWLDYKFPNPSTKTVEAKSSYCERVSDKLVCSGIYKKIN
jgi:cytochrome c